MYCPACLKSTFESRETQPLTLLFCVCDFMKEAGMCGPRATSQIFSALYWWRENQHGCTLKKSNAVNTKQQSNKQEKRKKERKRKRKKKRKKREENEEEKKKRKTNKPKTEQIIKIIKKKYKGLLLHKYRQNSHGQASIWKYLLIFWAFGAGCVYSCGPL